MKTRTFGRLGWQVSEVGFGAAWLPGMPRAKKSPSASFKLVDRALSAGINFIDTARHYGPSEEILGDILQSVKKPCYLATKTGATLGDFDYTRDGVLKSAELSLKLLRRDHVDLLQIHEANVGGFERIMGPGGALAGLQALKAQRVCTGIGITGRDPAALAQLVDTGEFDSVLSYCDYDLTTALAREVLIPVAQQHDTAVILASPLRCGGLAPGWGQRLEHSAPREAATIRKLAQAFSGDRGPLHHVALRYLWGDSDVSTVLSGFASIADLDDTLLAYSKGLLAPEELAIIRDVQRPAVV